MSKRVELREKVFQSGNLVTGKAIELFDSYVGQGLRTPIALGKNTAGLPDGICFALLSTNSLPDRYEDAIHYGPGSMFPVHSLGIIVSRERLLAAFPGQVYAVGEGFRSSRHNLDRSKYNYRNGRVFDIPIKEDLGRVSFADEVRFYPADPNTAAITEDMWDGITVGTGYLHRLADFLGDAQISRPIPVFSGGCNLLVTDVRKLLRG